MRGFVLDRYILAKCPRFWHWSQTVLALVRSLGWLPQAAVIAFKRTQCIYPFCWLRPGILRQLALNSAAKSGHCFQHTAWPWERHRHFTTSIHFQPNKQQWMGTFFITITGLSRIMSFRYLPESQYSVNFLCSATKRSDDSLSTWTLTLNLNRCTITSGFELYWLEMPDACLCLELLRRFGGHRYSVVRPLSVVKCIFYWFRK